MSIRDLLFEVRTEMREFKEDIQKRLIRVEIGGTALTALLAWQLSGQAKLAIPPAAVGVWQSAKHFLTIF